MDAMIVLSPTCDPDLVSRAALAVRMAVTSGDRIVRETGGGPLLLRWPDAAVEIARIAGADNPFDGIPDDDMAETLGTVAGDVVGVLYTTDAATRRAMRTRIRATLRIRLIVDLPLFRGSGVDHAENGYASSATPWSPRRSRLSQMETPPFKGRTLSATLPPAPELPVACECGARIGSDGIPVLTLEAVLETVERPWSFDVVEMMRLIGILAGGTPAPDAERRGHDGTGTAPA